MKTSISLAFDSQIEQRQSVGGISRYFQELRQGLSKHTGIKITEPEHAKVLHATFYDGKPPQKSQQLLVSSLYDMTPEKYHYMFPYGSLRNKLKIGPHYNKKSWLANSDLIISISKASADDLTQVWPKIKKHIEVIHLGTSIEKVNPEEIPKLLGKRFWLIVGKRGGYKNGMMLMHALKELARDQDMPLLFAAGGGAWSREERKLINEAKISRLVHQESVNEAQLAWLYRHAEAVLVPSMAEGFSLPLIEALACNTAVIASDIPAHREISEKFATLIPSQSEPDWIEILDQAIQSPLTQPLTKLGLEEWTALLAHYSTEKMVNAHVDAYCRLGY